MSSITWEMKYSVYPFKINKSKDQIIDGQIVVFDKGGAVLKIQGEEQHFKNFIQAMQFVTNQYMIK